MFASSRPSAASLGTDLIASAVGVGLWPPCDHAAAGTSAAPPTPVQEPQQAATTEGVPSR
jgi:hypothetical protein